MKNIEECVELIKLGILAGNPIIWIVVKEKEVADKIATLLQDEHLGGLSQTTENYMFNTIYAIGSKIGSKIGSNTRVSSNINTHSIYFDWVGNLIESKEQKAALAKCLEAHLNLALGINLDPTYRAEKGEFESKYNVPYSNGDISIITSPEVPELGWLNSYIETIYISSISDEDILQIISSFESEFKLELKNCFKNQLVVNFRGLSERQMKSVLLKSLVSEYFDNSEFEKILNEIRNIKKQLLEGFSGLKWINVNQDDPEVAGLDAILNWLKKRRSIFYDPDKSTKEGFDIPKGLLVTGIPGTGKSLMAKQSALIMGLPLISMDLGDLQEGVVGKSEEHMSKALRMVDTLAPCVLWIDEIEKAFSGSESGKSDGGVMRRMFGKFLTWMQEKKSYCFVLATSNDITKLPPELFRSQRFDEKFYTFMPSSHECAKMFCANIKLQNKRMGQKNGMPIKLFDATVFESFEYWLNILNTFCCYDYFSPGEYTEREVTLDEEGNWQKGSLPQKKLLTGADIAALVNTLKFNILTGRKTQGSTNYNMKGPIKKIEADYYVPIVLSTFMPYGQTNLKDIAENFMKLAKNRFRSASSEFERDAIINFSDYNELENKMQYDSSKYTGSDSTYDRTLYRCIIGAINGLRKRHENVGHLTNGNNASH